MRVGIIVNPASGRAAGRARRGAERAELARRIASECALEAVVVETSGPGHATSLAQSFVGDGMDRVVAWGGDGTVNETAGPLIGTRVALGIVAGGSGDGAAGSLGLIGPPDRALRLALTGTAGPIDVGWLGDRHFLNVGGVGFDAEVARAFGRHPRRGLLGYLQVGLPLCWTYEPAAYRITSDGVTVDARLMFASFANGRQYGNGMVLAPRADPSDGQLDLAVAHATTPMRFIWRARRLLLPTERPMTGVERWRVRNVTVAGTRLVCHVDGESFELQGEFNVRVQPAGLDVVGVSRSAREASYP